MLRKINNIFKSSQYFLTKRFNVFSSMLLGLVFAGLFSVALFAFAIPPGSKYAPGETNDPSCNPGDTNCTVTSSVPYTGATDNVDLGSKTLTTTGAGSLGSLTLSTTPLSVGNGGTGKTSWTQYLIPYADTTTSFSQIAIGTALKSPGKVREMKRAIAKILTINQEKTSKHKEEVNRNE